jgi:GWxTD domain-containing protein
MKRVRIALCALLFTAIAATSLFAALSKDNADFPKGPAQYLLTKDEIAEWSSVQTDEEALAFINRFWARRDPTPGTPANEFRNGYNERVKLADQRFHTARLAGSLTDRGKVFIALGGPTHLKRSRSVPASTIQAGPTFNEHDSSIERPQEYSPKELWEYDQGKVDIKLGQPLVEVVFIDQYGTNDWKLERQQGTDIVAVLDNVARGYVVAQSAPPEAPAAYVDLAATAPQAMKFRNDAAAAAVDAARAGTAAASPNLYISVGEYVTPAGEDFVPVQLYMPAGNGVDPGAAVTFFGALDKGGQTIGIFEEPATLLPSNGAVYVSRSFSIPPGEYRGVFGILQDGKPAATISTPIAVTGLDKDAAGVSPLILSNHVYPLADAQASTDPFSFGGLRVVPKSDATFHTKDDLWMFVELRNPGLDATSKAPKLSVKMSLTGTTAQGAPVKMMSPAEETPAQELKGVPGHWAVGQSMPLSTFKPGEYTLALKVTDVASNRTYDLTGHFRVVE